MDRVGGVSRLGRGRATLDPYGPPRLNALGYLERIARSATRYAFAVCEPASRVTSRALRRAGLATSTR